MRHISIFALVLSLVGCLVGCSSLGRKFDGARADRVKKVALLSFEVQQQQPKDSLGLSKVNELSDGAAADRPELQGMAKNIYGDLVTQIEKASKWKFVPLSTLAANADYKRTVDASVEGLHGISMTGKGYDLINYRPVLNNYAYRKMSHADKVKFAKSVGADAYAEYVLIQSIEQGWSIGNLTGNAPFAFKGRANLIVHGLDSEEPLWQIQNIDGEITETSDSLPNAPTKLQQLAIIGEKAAHTANAKLASEYGQK